MSTDRPLPHLAGAPRSRHGEAIYATLLVGAAGLSGPASLAAAVPALHLHLGRLRSDAVAFALPWPGQAAVMTALCDAAAAHRQASRLDPRAFVRLRVDLYADDDLDPVQAPGRAALVAQSRPADDRVRSPARVAIGPRLRSAGDPLAGCKRASVATERALLRAAQGRGHDDVLLLDVEGRLSEATTSALLVGRGGRLYTPSEAAAPLRSTTMALLEALLDPTAGPSPLGAVSRVDLLPTDLQTADFALMVNAVSGGRPIAFVEGTPLPSPPAGLVETLRDLVDGGAAAHLAVERLRRGHGPAWAQRALRLGEGDAESEGGTPPCSADGAGPGA